MPTRRAARDLRRAALGLRSAPLAAARAGLRHSLPCRQRLALWTCFPSLLTLGGCQLGTGARVTKINLGVPVFSLQWLYLLGSEREGMEPWGGFCHLK